MNGIIRNAHDSEWPRALTNHRLAIRQCQRTSYSPMWITELINHCINVWQQRFNHMSSRSGAPLHMCMHQAKLCAFDKRYGGLGWAKKETRQKVDRRERGLRGNEAKRKTMYSSNWMRTITPIAIQSTAKCLQNSTDIWYGPCLCCPCTLHMHKRV